MYANCRALAKNPTFVSMLTSYTIRTAAAVSIYKATTRSSLLVCVSPPD